jgi:hypothetical protein
MQAFLACIFPFPRLASLIFVARASTPTLKTAGYAGYMDLDAVLFMRRT